MSTLKDLQRYDWHDDDMHYSLSGEYVRYEDVEQLLEPVEVIENYWMEGWSEWFGPTFRCSSCEKMMMVSQGEIGEEPKFCCFCGRPCMITTNLTKKP